MFYKFFRRIFQLPANVAKVIIVKYQAPTTLKLTLHGPTSTGEGIGLSDQLNTTIAHYNTIWGLNTPNQQKITAVTNQPS
jgi:hypothetical protein